VVDHLYLMVWHALLVATFFAFLWRRTNRDRALLFVKAFLIMTVGAVVLGWLMYPFP
jgi:cytochrome bd-type quinol oxidase subunit 2